jgi:Resolvase, N terminal domain
MKQLTETVERLRVRGIGFRSPTEAPDTTTAQGRLVFHMFGAFAEFERSPIRERTQAGLAAVRRAGRTGGRPPKLTNDEIEAAKAMQANPDIGVTQIAHRLGLSRRRSIGTSPPREPRIRRAFDNGRSTPKTGRSKSVSAWRRAAAVRRLPTLVPSPRNGRIRPRPCENASHDVGDALGFPSRAVEALVGYWVCGLSKAIRSASPPSVVRYRRS